MEYQCSVLQQHSDLLLSELFETDKITSSLIEKELSNAKFKEFVTTCSECCLVMNVLECIKRLPSQYSIPVFIEKEEKEIEDIVLLLDHFRDHSIQHVIKDRTGNKKSVKRRRKVND